MRFQAQASYVAGSPVPLPLGRRQASNSQLDSASGDGRRDTLMDANQRKQGRINNTAAAISAGTLENPEEDQHLPYHPSQPYVDAHNADADGQRDAQNDAWMARARREADDIYDYSQPSNRPPHQLSLIHI